MFCRSPVTMTRGTADLSLKGTYDNISMGGSMARAIHTAAFTAIIVLISQAVQAAESPPTRVALAIEAQPLRSALATFAEQTGLQILQREEDSSADGLIAPRVVGELSPKEALDRLLLNSGL